MTENQIMLLLQIPLAGVVVLVVVLFLRHLKETVAAFMAAQKEQLLMFMAAIKEQREMNVQSLKEVSKNLDELGVLIVEKLGDMEVSRALLDHDTKRKEISK